PGGEAGRTSFHCRRRVFRVLATKVEQSVADQKRNISAVCAEMRMQVWGEKYPNVNSQYQEWCRRDPERVKRGICAPAGAALPGEPGSQPLPFLTLSREELLYFFGHEELFCRADRPGLTHFLDNQRWAKTFSCGIARGILEAGPFEEGVQTCAVVPFSGNEPASSIPEADVPKAR